MTHMNPKYESAQNFYKTQGKKLKQPAQIGKRKETQLEELKWTDKVFTGDNPKLTAFLSGQARERENMYNADYKKRHLWSGDGVQKQKEELNADAEQET